MMLSLGESLRTAMNKPSKIRMNLYIKKKMINSTLTHSRIVSTQSLMTGIAHRKNVTPKQIGIEKLLDIL